MKIVYLNYMRDLYGRSIGSTIKAIELFNALQKFNYDIKLEWRCEETVAEADATGDSSKPSALKRLLRIFLFTPRQVLQIFIDFISEYKIIKKQNPDLLIVRLDAFRASGLLLKWCFRIPMIIEADGASSFEWVKFHNGPHLWTPVLYFCEKKMLRAAQGIFVQSQVTKDYYLQKYKLDPEKIAVITNGAHFPNTQNELKPNLDISDQDIVIGFVGSMHYWHGMDQMTQFVSEILVKYPNVKFLFVGSGGPLAESFKSSFPENKNRIIFTGTVQHDKVQNYIQQFTIAIAPYPAIQLFYFSPVKLFEYMAAGKPIVAARIGQIADVLEHNKTGMLYSPGDLSEMHSHINILIENQALMREFGENAQIEFQQKYTWEKKGKELDEFIRKTVA